MPTIPRKKQIIVAASSILVLLVLIAGVKAAQIRTLIKSGESFVQPPEAVTTAPVKSESWQSSLTAVGSVVALKGVNIAAELAGTVRQISFESGEDVKQGDLLLRLDTSTEQAELSSAEANASLAEADLARAVQLQAANVSSAAELDGARARAAQANAAVQNIQATIGKKVIRAPFSGRLGIRQVDIGEFVQPGTPIVELQSYQPVYVDFSLPQQALAQIAAGQAVIISSDTFAEKTWKGTVETVNAVVDPSTRNVLVRAIIDNPEGELRPGMFVDVQVAQTETRNVLVIPETAVLHAPYGDSVFIVKYAKDEKTGKTQQVAEQAFVRLGESRGDFTVVTSGVEAGQTIVSTGAFKLRNGMPLLVKNDLAPNASEKPTPENQ